MEENQGPVNVLEGLSEAEISQLEQACELHDYAPGAVIFRQGDPGDELFIVRSGVVRISKSTSLNEDRTLIRLGAGGVFGELAMVGEGSRSASASALEETRVLALSRERFLALSELNPSLGLRILGRFAAMLAERLRLTTDLLQDTVEWGLKVSGASRLNLHSLSESQAAVNVNLLNKQQIKGKLLKVDISEVGHQLLVSASDGELHLIPYPAIASIQLGRSLFDEPEASS